MPNKRVQRTLHKVSGPLTRDVGIHKMITLRQYVGSFFVLLMTGCGHNDYGDPLLNASYDGDVERVIRILDAGTSPNHSDSTGFHTPLTLAAYKHNPDVISLLITRGADVNLQNGMGDTPLHIATYSRQYDCAKILLESGADQSITNSDGRTPIFNAVAQGPTTMVALLLSYPIDLSVRDFLGWQPLHAALRSNELRDSPQTRYDIVRMLLDHGADPNFINLGGWEQDFKYDSYIGSGSPPPSYPNRGNTPLEIAISNGFTNIVELLENYGTKK